MSELTDDRLREIVAAYRPAECDPDNCDDPFCPYVHFSSCGNFSLAEYAMARELLALRAAASTSTEGAGVTEPAILSVAAEAESNGMPVTARCLRKLAAKVSAR